MVSGSTPSPSREEELRKSIDVYRSLIALHQSQVDKLRARRRAATDSIMAEIDDLVRKKEELIAALGRIMEATELQLAALKSMGPVAGKTANPTGGGSSEA